MDRTNFRACSTDRLEFVFRPEGQGRQSGIVFLWIWLCAWAVGEVFALIFLGRGAWAVLTGRPLFGTGETVGMAAALAVGIFLLVWLAIWTIGGIVALRQLMRLVWGEDRIILDRVGIQKMGRTGILLSQTHTPLNDIRRVFIEPRSGVLKLQTAGTTVVLTDLGTLAERREAARQLTAALEQMGKSQVSSVEPVLPTGWQELTESRGEQLVLPNVRTRRMQAVALAVVTSVVAASLVLLVNESVGDPNLWPLAFMLTAGLLWLVWKTHWLWRGREEWRIERGKIIFQRRVGRDVSELYEARSLEITESLDSDRDPWYYLYATEITPVGAGRRAGVPERLLIVRSFHDDTEPRALGQWISQRAGIPFHDRVPTAEQRKAENARLKEQLRRWGALGRFLSRQLDDVEQGS